MAYKARTTNGIWMQESSYRDSPAGKLEEFGLVGTMNIPLQQGFDSNSQARLSVRVDYLSTFLAFEQGVVGTMSVLSHSTAVAAPFACVPAVDDVQMNIIVKAPLLKDILELEEWDTHDSSVKPFSFGIEPPEILNGDISIIFDSKIDDLFYYLTEVCADKVSFLSFQSSEFLCIFQGLKQCSSFHESFSPCIDVPSEVCLVENPAFRGNYADSEMLGIDINAKDIPSLFDFSFFGEISNNLQVFAKSECLACPSISYEGAEPLVIPVLFDRNSCPVPRISSEFNKEVGFGIKCLAVSGNIELDCQAFGFSGFSLLGIPYEGTSDLNIEGGVFLAG